jgi:hypothetical protein
MPKYYFDVLLGAGLTIDDIGTDLASAAAAEKEATTLLVELARDKHRRGNSSDIEIIVRSENDEPLLAGKISVAVERLPGHPKTQID